MFPHPENTSTKSKFVTASNLATFINTIWDIVTEYVLI